MPARHCSRYWGKRQKKMYENTCPDVEDNNRYLCKI